MDDLEQIRKDKYEKMQQDSKTQEDKLAALEQADKHLDLILKQILSLSAKERLANVKMVNREIYLKASEIIVYAAKSGKLKHELSEAELIEILKSISNSNKKEFNIRRI